MMMKIQVVGRNSMNVFVKVLPLTVLLAFSFTIEAKTSIKQERKVDAKCFVELVGGGETITFFNIQERKLSSLSKTIVGHKVSPLSTDKKVKIYKAHECVLLKANFKGSKAKIVDAKTAR